MVTFIPPDRPVVAYGSVWAERVNEQAKGELIIEVVGGPEVIGMFEQVEAVRTGKIDIAVTSSIYAESIMPESIPYVLSEYTAWEERERGFYDWIKPIWQEKMNAFFLGRTSGHNEVYWWSNIPVERPQELVEQKIAAQAAWEPGVRAWDAVPIFVVPMDLYTAVERGLIEGFILSVVDTTVRSLQEVVKYVIDVPLFSCNVVCYINLDTWNQIPSHLQALMVDIFAEVEVEVYNWYAEEEPKARKVAEDAGVEFITFSAEDAKIFRERVLEAGWEEFRPKVSPEVYTKMRDFLKK